MKTREQMIQEIEYNKEMIKQQEMMLNTVTAFGDEASINAINTEIQMRREKIAELESALNPELVSYTVEYEDGEVKEVLAKDEIQAMEIAGIDMFTDRFGKVVSIKEGKPEQTLELYEIFRERAIAEGMTDYQWFRHNRIQCWAEEACYYFNILYHTMIEGVEQIMPKELVEIANKIEITAKEEKAIMDIIIQAARNIIRQ